MKIFRKQKFKKAIYIGFLLLIVAGAGICLSLVSVLNAIGPRWRSGGALIPSVIGLTLMFIAFLLASCIIIVASLALLWRERVIKGRTETKLIRFIKTAEESADLITIMTEDGKIEYVNKAVEQTTGFLRGELTGKKHEPRLPWYTDGDVLRQMQDTLRSGAPFHATADCRTKDGGSFIIQEHVEPFQDRGSGVTRIISTAKDITQEKRLRDRLDYLEKFDSLTGLPNRRTVTELLEQSITVSMQQNSFLSVLIMDINQFKHVNDLFGHEAGDKVLKWVSKQIRSSVNDRDIAARIGNNEFAVIHFDDARPVDAGAVAEKIRSAMSQNIAVGEHDIVLTVSIGIALYPDNGSDAGTLLKNADLALSNAKVQGRNVIQFFDEPTAKQIKEFFILEKHLFNALKNNEYMVYYQPYCDLFTRKVSGAEALIKWKNPDLGMVSPSKFIPSLEDTGMIIDVGRWVLETACAQSKKWEEKNRDFPVSVNLSLAQFRHKYLIGMVRDAIEDYRLSPNRLTLEVTESVFMHDMEFAIKNLRLLKNIGVSLSVDDFGTGYSSLSYIKKLPVDNLKIDISFVRDVTKDQDAASIVTAITTLARSLQIKTIAEGVETEEQRNILHLLRCDMGQGYLFSPAVSTDDFEKILM